MRIGLVYATRTKHSRKLAAAIGERLHIAPEDISLHPEPQQALDLLLIVGGIYGGESMPQLLEYVKGLDASRVKRAALVTSCGSGKTGQASVRRLLEEKGITVVNEFICPGAILFVAMGRPNKRDLREAADFAETVAREL